MTLCKVQALVWNIYRDPPTSEIEVGSSSLKIVVKQGVPSVETELVFPEHMLFKPDTVSTRLERNVFRDRQEFVQPMPCIELTINVLFEETNSVSKPLRVMQANTPYRLMCVVCSAETLGDEVSFNKVLPLPSEEWEEKAGEWFCHPVAEARNIRVPGVHEMFISPTKLIVHDILIREAFFRDKQLYCETCRSVLGRSETDTSVALFRTRVKVELLDDEDDQTCVTYGGRDAPDVLVAVIREHLGESQTGKVLVQAGNQALLLWLVERDLVFFYRGEVQGQTVVVDARLGSKVMYLVTNDSDGVVAVWKEDPLVSEYKFEKEVMEDSIYYLENCCKSMGATFERFRGIFLPEEVP